MGLGACSQQTQQGQESSGHGDRAPTLVTALSWVKSKELLGKEPKACKSQAGSPETTERGQQELALSVLLHPSSFSRCQLFTNNFFLVTTGLAASFEPSANGT